MNTSRNTTHSPKKSKKKTTRREFVKKVTQSSALLASATLINVPTIKAQNKIKWKLITTWPKNFPAVGTGANRLAKHITEMSGGRLEVKVYGAGEMVPALGVFDACRRGTAQMGHGASYYWKGKHSATQFFAAIPFGLNAQEMNGWLYHGDGLKLWNELYDSFGLVPFPAGNTGVQMGGWYNKEIKTVADFKGLKMRMPGLGGEVLRRLGSTVVTIPGGEVFQALKSGAIDASEWIGPYNDQAFGLHKAAKFYYWPGWHEPGTTLECMVNKKAYLSLPSDLKAIVKAACEAANNDILAEFTARNSTALLSLTTREKVQLKRFSDDILKKIGAVAKQVAEEEAAKDPISMKIYSSYKKFREQSIRMGKISEQGFANARSISSV